MASLGTADKTRRQTTVVWSAARVSSVPFPGHLSACLSSLGTREGWFWQPLTSRDQM